MFANNVSTLAPPPPPPPSPSGTGLTWQAPTPCRYAHNMESDILLAHLWLQLSFDMMGMDTFCRISELGARFPSGSKTATKMDSKHKEKHHIFTDMLIYGTENWDTLYESAGLPSPGPLHKNGIIQPHI